MSMKNKIKKCYKKIDSLEEEKEILEKVINEMAICLLEEEIYFKDLRFEKRFTVSEIKEYFINEVKEQIKEEEVNYYD